jgi:hypothetical protein
VSNFRKSRVGSTLGLLGVATVGVLGASVPEVEDFLNFWVTLAAVIGVVVGGLWWLCSSLWSSYLLHVEITESARPWRVGRPQVPAAIRRVRRRATDPAAAPVAAAATARADTSPEDDR